MLKDNKKSPIPNFCHAGVIYKLKEVHEGIWISDMNLHTYVWLRQATLVKSWFWLALFHLILDFTSLEHVDATASSSVCLHAVEG